MQKILNRMPFFYAASVMLFIIAPLVYIARYNHAGSDDFQVSGLLMHTGSVLKTATVLMQRSAAYTGVFLQALLQPADIEGIGFKLVPVGIIATYLMTFYTLAAAFLPQSRTDERICFALACFSVFFRLTESPMQTFFWSMSAIIYTSGYFVFAIFILMLVRYLLRVNSADNGLDSAQNIIGRLQIIFTEGFGMYAAMAILMLLTIGFSGVVSLLTVGLCAGAWVYVVLNGPKQKQLPLAFLLLGALLLLVYLLGAPGSLRRIAESGSPSWTERPIIAPAIFAFNMYRDYLAKWFSDSLFMLGSLALVFWLSEKRAMPQLRLPVWLPFAASIVCGYLWFFVPKFSVGYIASRHADMALVFFITGWLVSLTYGAAFLRERLSGSLWRPVIFAAMLLTLLLPQYVSNMRFLWTDICSGAAAQHDKEMKRRYALMRTHRGKAVELPPLQTYPITIYKGDLEADTAYWVNRAFARYFGQTAVSVKK